MRTNRNKAISHYQKEANLLQNEYDEYDAEERDKNEIPYNDDAIPIATEPIENPTTNEATATKMEQATSQTEGENPAPSEATNEQAESAQSGTPEICPYVLSVYETVMLIQLKRMIKRNTKAFAVMLKILIQGDPKRKP